MTARKYDQLANLPGKAALGGYVYVVAFDNGVVKVGRTVDPYSRLAGHASGSRSFGARLTEWWVSPLHDGWKDNERGLILLAQSLGGVATGSEYFTGITFAEMVEKAKHALRFPAFNAVAAESDESLALREAVRWLDAEVAAYRRYIAIGVIDEGPSVEAVTTMLLREPALARLILSRYVRRRLAAAKSAASPPEPPEPELTPPPPPPEPCAPMAFGHAA